ncbi:putative RNA/DNA demethylase ALKBH6 [Ciona intestinalis]
MNRHQNKIPDVQNIVQSVPNTAYYIPNFITEQKEQFLLNKIYKAPKTKWTCLSNRRLQNWGGIPQPKGMLAEKLPDWLTECCEMIQSTNLVNKTPNHVLVNEYKPGQGIMPHKDGPLYYPTVATISLGSHTCLDFYDDVYDHGSNDLNSRYKFSFLLERRSLLILKDSMYEDYLHGISERQTDQIHQNFIKNSPQICDCVTKTALLSNEKVSLQRENTRLSLTIRFVPKTFKLKFVS